MDQKTALLIAAATCTVMIAATAINQTIKKRKCAVQRKTWTRNWIKRRLEGKGILNMLNNELLTEDPVAYRNFLRMTNASFNKLLNRIEQQITKKDSNMRESILARSKLETTLRFLATGESYRSLMYNTRIHESTMSRFIPEICGVIYHSSKDESLTTPSNPSEWIAIAEGFENAWQFPNCLGALDGRHITFRPPVSAGSYYYNYKGTHSIVLLAMADSAYKFIYYNVGVNGRISDGGVFRESGLAQALVQNSLNLPNNRRLPNQSVATPYVIIVIVFGDSCDCICKTFVRDKIHHLFY